MKQGLDFCLGQGAVPQADFCEAAMKGLSGGKRAECPHSPAPYFKGVGCDFQVTGPPVPNAPNVASESFLQVDRIRIDFDVADKAVRSRPHFDGDKVLETLEGNIELECFNLNVVPEAEAGCFQCFI